MLAGKVPVEWATTLLRLMDALTLIRQVVRIKHCYKLNLLGRPRQLCRRRRHCQGPLMLSWPFQPDEAFAAMLDSSLSICIDQLGDRLGNQLAATNAETDGACLTETRMWELFELSQLRNELQKLLRAHRAAKLYLPTDYHFLMLHEVLEVQISHHNNRVSACDQPLAFGSVLLGHVDFDFVRDYFWDEDFLFDPEVMAGLSEQNKVALGFNQETFALVQGLKPHPQELELQEVNTKPEPGQNYYKRGECYPYEVEQLE